MSYLVICRDDRMIGDSKGPYVLSTTTVFPTPEAASLYLEGIADSDSRDPSILTFILAVDLSQLLRWTGPNDEDFLNGKDGSLRAPIPPERWPYGPPEEHEQGCSLHTGGLWCDCKASASDDTSHGELA